MKTEREDHPHSANQRQLVTYRVLTISKYSLDLQEGADRAEDVEGASCRSGPGVSKGMSTLQQESNRIQQNPSL
ncbi:unnamed protein product [Knipowitschia caucasica]|uniref:Uncharacterized protein n=1 Tax=Knipowitschia caucasica TaxID=637954 RepID=A0AAV2L9P9_KNICA